MDDSIGTYDRNFKLLQSENRKVRKQNLDELMTVVCDDEFDVSSDFLLAAKTFVYPCLNDGSEACRESAIQLVKKLVSTGQVEDIIPIVFIIHKRLGNVVVIENSEEVRFLYIQLLREIIKYNGLSILPCLDDLISILSKTILDSCPTVKKDSCLCAAELASATKTHFHMVADTLIEPLLKTTNYHQSNVRYTAIQSLSKTYLYFFNFDFYIKHFSIYRDIHIIVFHFLQIMSLCTAMVDKFQMYALLSVIDFLIKMLLCG